MHTHTHTKAFGRTWSNRNFLKADFTLSQELKWALNADL